MGKNVDARTRTASILVAAILLFCGLSELSPSATLKAEWTGLDALDRVPALHKGGESVARMIASESNTLRQSSSSQPYKIMLPAIVGGATAAEPGWPMVAANPQRTSWTPEAVTGDLHVEWYRPIEAYIPQHVQIIAANELLYISTARGLYALGAASGQEVWRYDTEMPLGHSPTVSDVSGTSMLFVGGYDRKIHAFNAITGQHLWEFAGAQAGYDTNPLVIGNAVYAGNRDGRLYALDAQSGSLLWQYPPAGQAPLGPISFSPAYKDGVIYFVANDNYAYALGTDGTLRWRSQGKLNGDGFHSYWPVIFSDPTTGRDYVVIAAASGYRAFAKPGAGSLSCSIEWCEWEDEFNGASGGTLGPIVSLTEDWAQGKTIVDYSSLTQYLEDNPEPHPHWHKPWRRYYFLFDAQTGTEYTMDTDDDGHPEYAPVDPYLSNSGNPYPAIAGEDSLLYMGNHYEYNGQSRVMGWRMGSPYLSIVGLQSAGDEPQALSFGGDIIYRSLCCDRVGDWASTSASGASGSLWVYDLAEQAPGYDEQWWFTDSDWLARLGGNYGNVNGVYHSHGDQNPLVPYAGRIYTHRSNAILAYGSGPAAGRLPLLAANRTQDSLSTPTPEALIARLESEVEKILAAGESLRPGYYNAGQFQSAYPELADYFENPGDTLYTLSIAYPHLSAGLQEEVRAYLGNEFQAHFNPLMVASVGWADGAAREAMPYPPEVSADLQYLGESGAANTHAWAWSYPQHNFYAMWKYAEIVPDQSLTIYDLAKAKLQVPAGGDADFFHQRPWVLNAYIAGYTGFLRLQEMADMTVTDAQLRSQVTDELNRLLRLRVADFTKDSLYVTPDDYVKRTLNVARNFMFLVPELGEYLRQQLLPAVQQAIDEYGDVGPYWFVSRYTASVAESTNQHLYDYPALFQARAYILKEPREELTKYLDVPAFARGDLFYIQNLVAAIEADDSVSALTPVAAASAPTHAPPARTTPVATSVPERRAVPDERLAFSVIRVQTPGQVKKFGRFEIAFDVLNSVAGNPYLPYDPTGPPGVPPAIGISVDMLLLPPGQTDWSNARTLPCFYYQPVKESGSGASAGLLPVGEAEWRCRFTPDTVGRWLYRLRAVDASGTAEGSIRIFHVLDSKRRGFLRISQTDHQYFEFSDGTLFLSSLVNIEGGNFLNGLQNLRTNLQTFGENGVRFVRWFPTGEGGNYEIIPFAGDMRSSWWFGSAQITVDEVDGAAGKRFSFQPYYYTGQSVPAMPGERYRLTFRALVAGDKLFLPQIALGTMPLSELAICAKTSVCSNVRSGWQDYTLEAEAPVGAAALTIWMRDNVTDDDSTSGMIRIHSIRLQRDETGNGDWGPNLLVRADPDTHTYVDQIAAARLDEVFRLSELYGVYHKLALFDKGDAVLNRFLANGAVTDDWDSRSNRFYSQEGQASRWYQKAYVRYFVARWSHTPALHSLELANENYLTAESYDAGFALAEYVHSLSPRPILMSNSFWGLFPEEYWNDAERGRLMDYADKHWYAAETGDAYDSEYISSLVNDSAANVRACWRRFREYAQAFDLDKPVIRGEVGIAEEGTQPQHPDVIMDPRGTYYHKKVWAQMGSGGYLCDGEWYLQPLQEHGLWSIYRAYDRFMQGEPLNSGRYQPIGTDLEGNARVVVADQTGNLRAWGQADLTEGRALLWIDNADDTWRNAVDDVGVCSVGGTLTIQGMPQGIYNVEWWDTSRGVVSSREVLSAGINGRLSVTITGLSTDRAVKFALDPAGITRPPQP